MVLLDSEIHRLELTSLRLASGSRAIRKLTLIEGTELARLPRLTRRSGN